MKKKSILRIIFLLFVCIVLVLVWIRLFCETYVFYKDIGGMIVIQTNSDFNSTLSRIDRVGLPVQFAELRQVHNSSIQTNSQTASNVTIVGVDDNYSYVVDVNPIHGQFNTSSNNIVVGYDTAIALFSDSDCIGEQVLINNHLFNISGVIDKQEYPSIAYYNTELIAYVGMDEISHIAANNYTRYYIIESNWHLISIVENLCSDTFGLEVSKIYKNVQTALFVCLLIGIILGCEITILFIHFINEYKYINNAIITITLNALLLNIINCCMLRLSLTTWSIADFYDLYKLNVFHLYESIVSQQLLNISLSTLNSYGSILVITIALVQIYRLLLDI